MFKKILLFFTSWKITVLFFAFLATFIFPMQFKFAMDREFKEDLSYYVWIWGNFDGFHYLNIAKHGPGSFEYPFFPFFPVLIKILFLSVGVITYLPHIIAAQIISNLSFILSLFVICKILLIDKKSRLLNILLLTIIFYPTSLFYGAVYNDSLFLLFTSLTIYFARKGSFLLAGFSGFFATLTRLNGLALFFLVFFEYIFSNQTRLKNQWDFKKLISKVEQSFVIKKIIKEKIYSILLIPAAFLGYLGYIQLKFGNWNLVFSSMKEWDQDKITFPIQVFWRYFKILVLYPDFEITYWVALIELLFVLFYIFMMFYSFKKIRLSYWIFFVVSMVIPSLTGTFQGMPRYGLHLYPLFLSIALFLKENNNFVKIIYFSISILLLFICLGLFTRGYFIA